MYKRDVRIFAGTDANLSIKVPGFSLHDELISLNEMVGMSPAEVLRSVTLHPSEWLGNNAGAIKEGGKANLVVLDKNPLEKIGNTKSINAVVLNGRFLDRAFLDNLLQQVKAANNASRSVDIAAFVVE